MNHIRDEGDVKSGDCEKSKTQMKRSFNHRNKGREERNKKNLQVLYFIFKIEECLK